MRSVDRKTCVKFIGIKNAIKYTQSGSIKIGYTLNEKGKNSELEFYVNVETK